MGKKFEQILHQRRSVHGVPLVCKQMLNHYPSGKSHNYATRCHYTQEDGWIEETGDAKC